MKTQVNNTILVLKQGLTGKIAAFSLLIMGVIFEVILWLSWEEVDFSLAKDSTSGLIELIIFLIAYFLFFVVFPIRLLGTKKVLKVMDNHELIVISNRKKYNRILQLKNMIFWQKINVEGEFIHIYLKDEELSVSGVEFSSFFLLENFLKMNYGQYYKP